MTTPDTLPECQHFCEQLKAAIHDLTRATNSLLDLALRVQISQAEEFTIIGRARIAIDRATALAGSAPHKVPPKPKRDRAIDGESILP